VVGFARIVAEFVRKYREGLIFFGIKKKKKVEWNRKLSINSFNFF
jgi:hypothetical protein